MRMGSDFMALFLGLVPAVSACALKDFAGEADAGVTTGGTLGAGSGGNTAVINYDLGGGEPGTGGDTPLGSSRATGGSSVLGSGGQTTGSGGTKLAGSSQATGGSSSVPTTLPTWATANGCITDNENSQFVGLWEGYIQGTPIGDEASSIRLNILGANPNGLCGTVTFGLHTAPVTLPPATDATGVYPPESIAPTNCVRPGNYHPLDHLLGFAYTIQNGKIDERRTTFAISYTELYKSWCPLQTSYPTNQPSGYNCLPNTGSSSSSGKCYIATSDGGLQEVTCTQMCLCTATLNVCACDPHGCVAALNTSETLFDLLFNGNQAMGTFGSSSVVFNRVDPCRASGEPCEFASQCCTQACEASDGGDPVCE